MHRTSEKGFCERIKGVCPPGTFDPFDREGKLKQKQIFSSGVAHNYGGALSRSMRQPRATCVSKRCGADPAILRQKSKRRCPTVERRGKCPPYCNLGTSDLSQHPRGGRQVIVRRGGEEGDRFAGELQRYAKRKTCRAEPLQKNEGKKAFSVTAGAGLIVRGGKRGRDKLFSHAKVREVLSVHALWES